MQNAEFANSTQTTIFYKQDMFESVFITSTKPHYIRTHWITPKIKLLGFPELLKNFKEREMKERRMHNYFYTGSLNHRATSSFPGQHEPGFHYIQKFYKSNTKITCLNTKHTRFLTHTKI